MNRTENLDLLILKEVVSCRDPQMNLLLSFEDEGYKQTEVDDRLSALRDQGFILLIESVGMTTVTGITQAGKVYLHSLTA